MKRQSKPQGIPISSEDTKAKEGTVWKFPVNLKFHGLTGDGLSFQSIDLKKETEIPIGEHPGAFGAKRKYDIHKGIDIYCPSGTEVYAVEPGVLCEVRPFTGRMVECPWWEDTLAVSVAGESGVVVYGELETISPKFETLSIENEYIYFQAREVKRGDLIGTVGTVLKHNKGRPMSMLHLELHRHGVLYNGEWELGAQQPQGLLDPTQMFTPR